MNISPLFSADNHQKLVANKEQLEDLVSRGVQAQRNQRVLDDLNALLAAPLWNKVLN